MPELLKTRLFGLVERKRDSDCKGTERIFKVFGKQTHKQRQ